MAEKDDTPQSGETTTPSPTPDSVSTEIHLSEQRDLLVQPVNFVPTEDASPGGPPPSPPSEAPAQPPAVEFSGGDSAGE
jgi:hypothetical protein